jgi:hypothetical protein
MTDYEFEILNKLLGEITDIFEKYEISDPDQRKILTLIDYVEKFGKELACQEQ